MCRVIKIQIQGCTLNKLVFPVCKLYQENNAKYNLLWQMEAIHSVSRTVEIKGWLNVALLGSPQPRTSYLSEGEVHLRPAEILS